MARDGRHWTVAIQGCAGSYSHEAAEWVLGRSVRLLACDEFSEVFAALTDGRAATIVIPIANSTIGPIHACRDLLTTARVELLDEVRLPVEHCLIARPGTSLARIRRVASHPAALAQCSRFLEARPHWTAIGARDTAGAVRVVAARLYGCRILRRGIQDAALNFTTFAAFRARRRPSRTADDDLATGRYCRALSRGDPAADRPRDHTDRDPCSPWVRPR